MSMLVGTTSYTARQILWLVKNSEQGRKQKRGTATQMSRSF